MSGSAAVRRFFILLFAMLSLVGCAASNSPAVTSDISENYGDSAVVINDYTATFAGLGYFDYNKISEKSGVSIKTATYYPEELDLKLLAGDSDVDIFFINSSSLDRYKENELYSELNSDVILNFNNSCFDSYAKACEYEGKTIAMPASSSYWALLIPKSAIEETGVTEKDVEYIDDFLSFVRNYEGERTAYTNGSQLFYSLEGQYERFYCDIAGKDINYMTEEYFDLYEKMLGGYLRNGQTPGAPEGFEHSITGDYSNNSEKALCTFGYYSDAEYFSDNRLNTNPDVYLTQGSADFFDKWRAFPIPKISEKITYCSVGMSVAIINPSSENKEAALKVLETIAENYFDTARGVKYSFLFADRSAYPEYYHTDSDIFNDYYEIFSNGVVSTLSVDIATSRSEIDDYQAGRLTLEEAVAEYQRQVDIWLNE